MNILATEYFSLLINDFVLPTSGFVCIVSQLLPRSLGLQSKSRSRDQGPIIIVSKCLWYLLALWSNRKPRYMMSPPP